MFGFNTVSLDAKGRLLIPARYRSDFKTLLIIKSSAVTEGDQLSKVKQGRADACIEGQIVS